MQSLIVFGAGMIAYQVLGHRIVGAVLFAMAAAVLVVGLFLPTVFDATQRFAAALARVIGVAVTWLLLVPFFYLCFVPCRIIRSIFGKDALRLKFRSDEATCWVVRVRIIDPDTYKNQY